MNNLKTTLLPGSTLSQLQLCKHLWLHSETTDRVAGTYRQVLQYILSPLAMSSLFLAFKILESQVIVSN